MSLLIGFLTFILVLNCLFLMLLILVQLPKKEAGAGIAFGGAATDALFGAGTGNALTKLTKYAGTLFVVLAIVLSVLNTQTARQGSRRLEQELSRQASTPVPVTPGLPATNAVTSTAPVVVASTNLTGQTTPVPPAVTPLEPAPANDAEAPVTPAPAPPQ